MSQMLKSSGALGIATLTSRVLGMVREIVYARFMGDTWVAGAFVLAFMIPNLFRRLLGEGAMTAAFVPLFKEKEKRETPAEMWRAANAVLSALILAAGAVVVIVVIGLSIALLYHGYNAKTRLMLELLRLMFPYMLLVCVTAVLIGMLNARGHFFMPAMGSTMLNVVMIVSVLWLAPRMGMHLHQQIFGLAIGVLVAGVAQMAFQAPSLRSEGYRFEWVSPFGNETVRRVAQQMIPGTIGVAAFQINILVTESMAYWLDPGIVASFNYAVRLMELPQGVIGISFATYLLPTLSGLAAEKNYPGFRQTMAHGLVYVFYLNLLAAVLLLVLAEPIVRLLFERGQFSPDATQRVSITLACLAPGLVAYSIVNILSRAFFALGDTSTPMRISLFCLVANLVLAFLLMFPFRAGGLAMANSITATINVGLLFYALQRKLKHLDLEQHERQLGPLLLLALIAGAATWACAWLWQSHWGHGSLPLKLGMVFVPMTLAALVYFGGSVLLRLNIATEVLTAFKKRS